MGRWWVFLTPGPQRAGKSRDSLNATVHSIDGDLRLPPTRRYIHIWEREIEIPVDGVFLLFHYIQEWEKTWGKFTWQQMSCFSDRRRATSRTEEATSEAAPAWRAASRTARVSLSLRRAFWSSVRRVPNCWIDCRALSCWLPLKNMKRILCQKRETKKKKNCTGSMVDLLRSVQLDTRCCYY